MDFWLAALAFAFAGFGLALRNAYRIAQLSIDLDYVKREAEEAKRAAHTLQEDLADVATESGLKWQHQRRGRWVKP